MALYLEFLDNLALLVLLLLISPWITKRIQSPTLTRIFQGGLFGFISIVGMLNPFVFGPGLIFDPRSVILSLSGFFWGPLGALISGGSSLIFRFIQGGVGTVMGISVIVASTIIGIGFNFLYSTKGKDLIVKFSQLYLMGFIVHIMMLMLTFTLPTEVAYQVLEKIGMIVIIVYPLATVLIGKLIYHFSVGIELEEQLKESEDRFKAISEYSNNAICLLNEEGRITWGNEALVKLGGYSLKELYTKSSFVDFLAPQSVEFVVSNFQKFVNGNEYQKNYTFYIKKSDGECRLCEKYMTDFKDKNKRRFLAISMLDITAKDLAQKALKKNEDFLKTIIDSLDESVYFIDTKFHLQMVNKTLIDWCEKINVDLKLGSPVCESLTFFPKSFFDSCGKVLTEGRFVSCQEVLNINNQPVHISVRKIPVYSNLRPLGILTVINDISEKVNVEKEKHAIQAQLFNSAKLASIGTLAAGVAHEINNPLSIILGNAELLRERFKHGKDEINLEMVQRIIQSTDRVVKVVDGLSLYARQDDDELDNIDIHECINDTLLLISAMYKKLNINIEIKLDASQSIVIGNTGKIQQVIMNLFANSKDALRGIPQAVIQIVTQNIDGGVIITISDNGPGIPKEIMGKLFDPFVTTKDPGKAAGLGLAISHTLIDSLRGKLEIESGEKGKTTFKIYLPLSAKKNHQVGTKNDNELVQVTGSALVVDDEDHIREILAAYLVSFGLEVFKASNGLEALEMITQRHFDYVITDIKMPVMKGDELITKIRELSDQEKLKLYYISGGLGDYTKDQLDNLRKLTNGFLDKPFTKDDVMRMISGDSRS